MTNKPAVNTPLLTLGIGIGVGAVALWAAVELLPVLVLGGGAWLLYKAVTPEINQRRR